MARYLHIQLHVQRSVKYQWSLCYMFADPQQYYLCYNLRIIVTVSSITERKPL